MRGMRSPWRHAAWLVAVGALCACAPSQSAGPPAAATPSTSASHAVTPTPAPSRATAGPRPRATHPVAPAGAAEHGGGGTPDPRRSLPTVQYQPAPQHVLNASTPGNLGGVTILPNEEPSHSR